MHEVGELVLGLDGRWMVRPPQWCGNGHVLWGNCLVSAQPCRCNDRHMSWCCNTCGDTVFGPSLGVDCSILNGAAWVR